MNETELLQAFRESRSETAFAQLVQRYAGLVYSVVRRRSANALLAEDITQLVFIRFAKSPPNVQVPSELAAWLHRITINVTIDTWRSETRRRNREQQAVVMEPALPENAVWEDVAPNLDAALDELPDEDRQALLLRFFGQKMMCDVGTAMGISEAAAKMRVSRALERLRTQLGIGGASCSVVVLGTMLTERSVEAVPDQLLSQLSAIKLPVAAGAGGMAVLFKSLLQISRFNLATGVVVLAIIGASVVHFIGSLNAPVPEPIPASVQGHQPNNATRNSPGIASKSRFNSGGFNAQLAPPAKPTKIMFHVLDAETGDGLANAKIHFAFFGPGGAGESHDILTDGNGDAAITEPDDPTKNGGPNVFVTAKGHVPKVVNFGSGGVPSDYTMKLDPAMTVGGWVVNEQGLPVSGVRIQIEGPGDILGQRENIDFQTCPVTNRDDGTWTCSYIPKDWTNEIRFILKKDGYAATFPVVPVAKVDLIKLVLVLDQGFMVTGRVLDRQNQSVANAHIRTLTGSGYNGKRLETETDANGVFTLTWVSGEAESSHEQPVETNADGASFIRGLVGEGPLHVKLVIQAEGFAPQLRTVELSAPTNQTDMALLPGKILRGQLVDESGDPISNAVVQTDWDNQGLRAFPWNTRTDADGRFEWDSAPEGPILFWFEADGYDVIRDHPLKADGSDHVITLKSKAMK